LPPSDRRLVVPNGRAKIILTLQNSLEVIDQPLRTSYPEGKAWFIGPWDRPVELSSPSGATRTVGLELLPTGVNHLFRHSLLDLRNRVVEWSDVEPQVGQRARELWAEQPSSWSAATVLTEVLLRMKAHLTKSPWLVDWVSAELDRSHGLVSIQELESRSGYSRRAIELAFKERVGLAPKTLATILRFQAIYNAWARSPRRDFYREPAFDLYADQSHLIREFRRYTGYAPNQFAKLDNEFGRIFYTAVRAK